MCMSLNKKRTRRVLFLFFYIDSDAIYLHACIGGDDDVFLAVHHLSLYQIAEFGVNADFDFGSAYLKLFAVYYVGGAKLCILSEISVKVRSEFEIISLIRAIFLSAI